MFNSMRGGNGPRRQRPEPPEKTLPPALPYGAPRPKTEPHRLGSITLANLDALTMMSADEIERVADRVEAGAREIADALRAAAYSMRQTGLHANERLSNFVKVANTCAEAARMMQESVAHADDPAPPPQQPQQPPQPPDDRLPPRNTYEPTDLASLAASLDIADPQGETHARA